MSSCLHRRAAGATTSLRAGAIVRIALACLIGQAAATTVAAGQVPTASDSARAAQARAASADSAGAAAYMDSLAGDTTHSARVRRRAARADSLARHPARLMAVTVTATPVRPDEPVQAITVTPAMIAQAPANSPWELLRQTAGVEVHEQGQGPGFASDLSIRGFSSDHSTDIALWIDGVPINEPVNGHAEGYNDFNLLFPQAIGGIDVIKGPSSALYGNFAFSGVVNVHTLEHLNGTQVELSGGSYGNAEGVLLAGFDQGGDTRGVLGLRFTHDDGWRPHSEGQIGQLHGRYLHDVSSVATIDLGIEGFLTTYNSPGFLDTTSYLAGRYGVVSNLGDGGYKRHAQERASLRMQLSPALYWRSTLYATQGTWNFWLSTPPGLGGLLEGTGVETREYDGRFGGGATSALTYTKPSVEVTVGGETRYDHSHYENWGQAQGGFREDSVAFALVHAHQMSGGAFVQSSFDVTRYLRFGLGARVDQLSTTSDQPDSLGTDAIRQRSKGIFSPKSGVLLRVLPWAALYVNASRGFRQADGVILDPTVPFITLWDYETGIKVDRGPLSLDASLFRMDLSNEQAFNGVTTISGGPSRRRGLDVSARAAVVPAVTLSTNFTVIDAKYTKFFDSDAGVDYSGQPVFNTSKFVGDAAVEVAPAHAIWRVRLMSNFQGAYTPFEEAVGLTRPGFALVHASAGVRLGASAHLDVGVRNLLNTRYRELESGYFITPGQSRTVYATVRYDVLR